MFVLYIRITVIFTAAIHGWCCMSDFPVQGRPRWHRTSEGAKNHSAEVNDGRDAIARLPLSGPLNYFTRLRITSAAIFTYTSAKRRGKEKHSLFNRAPAVRLGRRGVPAVRKRAIEGTDRES
jgi:hypothetical protein